MKMPKPENKMPTLENNSLDESLVSSESSNELETPEHTEEFKAPEIDKGEFRNDSEKLIPTISAKKAIECIADRKGFYNQERLEEGDKFKIKSEEEFGEWFHCVDPDLERKRKLFLKEKKAMK